MDIKQTNLALNEWAKAIVADAKKNAIKEFGSNTNLKNNLKQKVHLAKNSFQISFFPGYATFADLGVRGKKGVLKNGKRSSPYQYKDKMPPISAFDKWSIRNIPKATKDEKTGRFIKRQSLKFALAKHVQMNGIKQTLFFTKPFEKYFKKLPEFIGQRFGEDVAEYYKTAFKDSVSEGYEIQFKKNKKRANV